MVISDYSFSSDFTNDSKSVNLSGFVSKTDMQIGLWEGRILKQADILNSEDASFSKVKSKLEKINIDSASFALNHEQSTHVGFDNFNPVNLKVYLDDIPENSTVEFEKLRQQKIVTVNSVSNTAKRYIDSIQRKNSKHHISTAMSNISLGAEDQILVMMYDKHMNVLIHLDGAMKFFKEYSGSEPNDFLYHLLHSADMLSIDINKIKVQIGGSIDSNSPLYVTLKSYIHNIEFFSSSRYHIDGAQLPYHYYMPLIVARACE